MINQFAKPIIFPLLDKNSETSYQFRNNVFMPFLQMTYDSSKDVLHSLKTEKILICGYACWDSNHSDWIFFKIPLGIEKTKIYVVKLNTTLYELPLKYQSAGALGFTFKLYDDMTVKPNIDGEQKAVMVRDFVWGE